MNQIFRLLVPKSIVIRCLSLFGIEELKENESFIKESLNENQVLENFKLLSKELKLYYIPCKSYIIHDDVNLDNIITITRQLLRLYHFKLVLKKKTKRHIYELRPEKTNDASLNIKTNSHEVVSFL